MTREEIEKAASDTADKLGINFSHNMPHLWIDFALDMVRKHNEECAKIAEYQGWEADGGVNPRGQAMTNKEVGELWSQAMHVLKLPNNGYALIEWIEASQNLIRKLVEERALVKVLQVKQGQLWTDSEFDGARRLALHDFGIDPKEFEK